MMHRYTINEMIYEGFMSLHISHLLQCSDMTAINVDSEWKKCPAYLHVCAV